MVDQMKCSVPKVAEKIIQVMDDYDLVLEPMVTWGSPI